MKFVNDKTILFHLDNIGLVKQILIFSRYPLWSISEYDTYVDAEQGTENTEVFHYSQG